MSENIVGKYPELRIYTVWVNQRVTDSRGSIDTASVPDSRHYWDDDRATGRWLGEKDLGGLGYAGAVYDAYYLFDGDATWDDVPEPLLASGQPVVDADALLTALDELG